MAEIIFIGLALKINNKLTFCRKLHENFKLLSKESITFDVI